jgi:branched-chain amino acid transport system permease protein
MFRGAGQGLSVDEKAGCPDLIRACLRAHPRGCFSSHSLSTVAWRGDLCLIALAFVLVYKASRVINFALGKWIMFGSLLASTGSHTIGLDLGGAVLFGCVGMAPLGVAFNAIVIGRLVMRPVISLIMVTLGLGALMRGVAALCFRGVPAAMDLPVSTDPVSFGGIDIPGDKLVAASPST